MACRTRLCYLQHPGLLQRRNAKEIPPSHFWTHFLVASPSPRSNTDHSVISGLGLTRNILECSLAPNVTSPLHSIRAKSLYEQYTKLLEPGWTTYPTRFTQLMFCLLRILIYLHCIAPLYCVPIINCILFPYLWSPYVIGRPYIFSCCFLFFMVALCNRADHYIFAL